MLQVLVQVVAFVVHCKSLSGVSPGLRARVWGTPKREVTLQLMLVPVPLIRQGYNHMFIRISLWICYVSFL